MLLIGISSTPKSFPARTTTSWVDTLSLNTYGYNQFVKVLFDSNPKLYGNWTIEIKPTALTIPLLIQKSLLPVALIVFVTLPQRDSIKNIHDPFGWSYEMFLFKEKRLSVTTKSIVSVGCLSFVFFIYRSYRAFLLYFFHSVSKLG